MALGGALAGILEGAGFIGHPLFTGFAMSWLEERLAKSKEQWERESLSFTTHQLCRAHISAAIREIAFYQNYPTALIASFAAHEIIKGHAKKYRIEIGHNIKELLRPDLTANQVKAFMDRYNSPYNSAKHLRGDLKVHPTFVECNLLAAINDYKLAFSSVSHDMMAYIAWIVTADPTLGGDAFSSRPDFFPSATLNIGDKARFTELRELIAACSEEPELADEVSMI